MKRFILLLLVALSPGLEAQVHLGIKAGGNLSKIDGRSFDEQYRLGYHAGAVLSADARVLGVQGEVLFNQSNTEVVQGTDAVYNNIASGHKTLNYLSIPVLLRINLGKFVTLNAGPQYSILMNSDQNLLENGQEAFETGDFALVGGVEINIKRLLIIGRYCAGFSDIDRVSNKATTQQFQLGLGFRLF